MGSIEVPPPSPSTERIPSGTRLVAYRRESLVFLDPADVWAFEEASAGTFVHSVQGKFGVEGGLEVVEASFARTLLRVHTHWLVDVGHVRAFDRDARGVTLFVGEGVGDRPGDEGRGVRVPVAREHVQTVLDTLLANATGLRRTQGRRDP